MMPAVTETRVRGMLAARAMADEGVIKFHAEHQAGPLPRGRHGALLCQLVAWREILGRTGLIGQHSELYDGYGYGNLSARVGPPSAPRGRRPFLVTGTQTSGKEAVGPGDFCRVDSWDFERNRVVSRGPVMPSSESLTHSAVFDLGSHIRFVFHGHSPVLWRRARTLGLPVSDPRVAYGTVRMAREVVRLYRESTLPESQILAMGGHEDGIVVFGRDAEEAGQILLRHLARAWEMECGSHLGLDRPRPRG